MAGFRPGNSMRSDLPETPLLLVVVIVVGVLAAHAFLPDGDLDSLRSEALAEWRALADSRELLGRVDGEHVTET